MNGQFEIGALSPASYFFSIAALIGLCFAFVAPENDGLSLGLRLLHWQTQTLGVMAFLIGTHLLLAKSRRFSTLNPWFRLGLSGILGASAYAPVAQQFDLWFGVESQAGASLSLTDTMNEWQNLAPPAAITWLAINAPWVMGLRLQSSTQPAQPEPVMPPILVASEVPPPPNLFTLLPGDIGSDIILLKSELHYLEVVTAGGRALILYRLRDAIAELAGPGSDQNSQMSTDIGLQCHRSYWIATAHIVRLQQQGREGLLTMSNGRTVPVSRRYLPAVKSLVNLQ